MKYTPAISKLQHRSSFCENLITVPVNNVYVPFRVGGVFPWLVKINNIHNIQLLLIKLVVHYIGHY